MAGDQQLAAPAVPILLKDLIEPEQKAGMDRADFAMTERIGPRIEVAAPILERGRTAENENVATIDDLDAPAYLVAVIPVVETVPRDRGAARILVNADAEVGDILVGNRHTSLPSRARSGASRLVLIFVGALNVFDDLVLSLQDSLHAVYKIHNRSGRRQIAGPCYDRADTYELVGPEIYRMSLWVGDLDPCHRGPLGVISLERNLCSFRTAHFHDDAVIRGP